MNLSIWKRATAIALIGLMSGCALTQGVRQQDLDAWVGRPVSDLEKQAFFITIPVVKTRTSDGTEIWNYVNGQEVRSCSGGGRVNVNTGNPYMSYGNYSAFTNCMSSRPACNNIFYIKGGRVTQYSPVGSGGMRCMTNEIVRPDYRGRIDYR